MAYFFLGSVLPPLNLGVEPELSFEELLTLLRDNLTRRDFNKVEKIRDFIDLKNVKRFLQKRALDPRGNLSQKELDEALATSQGLPEYVYDHLNGEVASDQIGHFSKVFVTFFKKMEEEETGFLSFYFKLERERRLLMIGFRSKKLHRDLVSELQYEDFRDPLVAHLLAQKDSPHFEFPFDYQDFDEQIKGAEKKPLEQYYVLARYEMNRLQERVQDHPFKIDYVLGYLIQFMLVQDWNQLSDQKGSGELNVIVKE